MANIYNESILQAIDTLLTQRLSEIKYDITVLCTVISKINEKEYIVKSDNSTFTAYSDDKEYDENQRVYVIIPQNNYSNKKIIIGSYYSDTTKASKYADPFSALVDATGNLIINYKNSLKIIPTTNEIATVSDKLSFDIPILPEELGNPSYIGVKVNFNSYLPDTKNGDYGINIAFGNDSGYEFIESFESTEFYGNPYMYDEGFIQEKIFSYPTSRRFKKIYIELYQKGNFDKVNENDIITLKEVYICFGYDKAEFNDSRFYLTLAEGTDTYSVGTNLNKKIYSTYFKFDQNTQETSVTTNPNYVTWYRYRAGNPNVGGGVHWEQLFELNEQSNPWMVENSNGQKRYVRARQLNNLLDQLNVEAEKGNDIEEKKIYLENHINDYNTEFLDSEEKKLELKEENKKFTIENLESVSAIVSAIEQPFVDNYLQGTLFIGKTGEGSYRTTSFPNTNYEVERIKAVLTLEDETTIESDPLLFNYVGEKIVDTEESVESNSVLELTLNDSGYNPVYGEDNRLIVEYAEQEKTVTASFADGLDWSNVKSITWKILKDALIIGDGDSVTENDYLVYTASKTEEKSCPNTFSYNFATDRTYTVSKAKTTIYCFVTYNVDTVVSNSVEIYFSKYGTSGTDFTVWLSDDNNSSPWSYINPGQQKVLRAHINDIEGKELELTEEEKEKFKWEWLYYDSEDNKATEINMIGENNSVITEYYGNQLTFKCGEELKEYCNSILKVTYEGFPYADNYSVNLICYHPIAATNITDAIGITGTTEVLYDTDGNVGTYNDERYYEILSEEGPIANIIGTLRYKDYTSLDNYNVSLPILEKEQTEDILQYYPAYPSTVDEFLNIQSKNYSIKYPSIFYDYNNDGTIDSAENLLYQDSSPIPGENFGFYYKYKLTSGKFKAPSVILINDQHSNLNSSLENKIISIKLYNNENEEEFLLIQNSSLNYNASLSACILRVPEEHNEKYNCIEIQINHENSSTDGIEIIYFSPIFIGNENNIKETSSPFKQKLKANPINTFKENILPWVCNVLYQANDFEHDLMWQQPIFLCYNQYETKFLNSWNGQFKLDEENNSILSSLLVAGEKDVENKFSGIVIGDIGKVTESNIEEEHLYGVYGYKKGVQSFGIDENGDAYFSGTITSSDGNGKSQFNLDDQGKTFIDYLKINNGDIKATSLKANQCNITDRLDVEKIFTVNMEYNVGNTPIKYTQNLLGPRETFRATITPNGTKYIVSNYGNANKWYNQQWKINNPTELINNKSLKITFQQDDSTYYSCTFVIAIDKDEDKGGIIGNSSSSMPTVANTARMNSRIIDYTFNLNSYSGDDVDKTNFYLIRNTHKNNNDGDNPGEMTYEIVTEGDTNTKFQVEENGYVTIWGGNINTEQSDKNVKNSIEPLTSNYLNLIKNVTPVRFKYNSNTSGRYHTGFIAQDIEKQLKKNNISTNEFSGFVDINYGTQYEPSLYLRYPEFIALNTLAIQDLYKYIEVLEKRIQELEKKEDKLE